MTQSGDEVQEPTSAGDKRPPKAWLNIEGCEFRLQGFLCSSPPSIVIEADEALPAEQIVSIEGNINDTFFYCDGARCEIELSLTGPEGVNMGFYASSSSGMSSPLYQALLRVVQLADKGVWQVNVLSDRLKEKRLNSCSLIWQTFPSLGALPVWLTTPQDSVDLTSSVPYTYLAGQLIAAYAVNATECVNFGLDSNGYANSCGIEKSQAIVDNWQDRFDPQIVAAARQTGVPAQLIKNIFAQESQFWPGKASLSR